MPWPCFNSAFASWNRWTLSSRLMPVLLSTFGSSLTFGICSEAAGAIGADESSAADGGAATTAAV